MTIVGGLLFGSVPTLHADEGHDGRVATQEYQLKAALLYKLTKFITWPEMQSGDGNFNFCVLGDNVFASSLEPLKERQANQKNIDIEYYDQSEEIGSHCDVLFIEASKEPFLGNILRRLQKPGVLTVSDIPDFAEQGGIVELTLENNKIGFKVNLASAKRAELPMAAPLLQLATIVEGASNGGSSD